MFFIFGSKFIALVKIDLLHVIAIKKQHTFAVFAALGNENLQSIHLGFDLLV